MNQLISMFPFLIFEYILSPDVIHDLQNNNIMCCGHFRTYSLVGIIKF